MKKAKSTDKEKITKVAAALFAKKGYAATSIRDIAQALNVSVSMFYYYFKDKEELLFSIIDAVGNELLEIQDMGIKDSSDPLMRLKHMLSRHICNIPRKKNNIKVFVEEQINLSEKHRNIVYKQHRKIYEVYLEQLVGLKKGKLIRFEELPVVVFGLIGMVNWTYRWYRNKGDVPIEDVAHIMVDLFLQGALSAAGRSRYKKQLRRL